MRLDTEFAEGVRTLVAGKHDFLTTVILHFAVRLARCATILVITMLSINCASLPLGRYGMVMT